MEVVKHDKCGDCLAIVTLFFQTVRVVMLRRSKLAPAVTAFGVASVGGYCIADEQTQRAGCLQVLGARRAFRAGVCAAELVLRYKLLAWRHRGTKLEEFQAQKRKVHLDCAARVLKLCRSNGGFFTKLGQHACTLKPAVPDEYIDVLAVLQDHAPSRPWCEVQAVLREIEQGGISPLREIDPEPVGSASLAQVHRASLHDGTVVAVKVQHQDIESILASDVRVIRWLDLWGQWAFRDDGFSMSWAVDEFEKNVKRELDFEVEAANSERCRLFFQGHRTLSTRVVVPRVHLEHSTRRVLTMDFAEGTPVSQLATAVRRQGETVAEGRDETRAAAFGLEAARCLVEAFGSMFFSFGHIHCDPHPGNLLVQLPPKGRPLSELRLVLLDHGLYQHLSEETRLAQCGLWKAMVLRDGAGVVRHCASMGIDAEIATLLPMYFVNQSMQTRAGLGESLSSKENAAIQQQLLGSVLSKSGSGGSQVSMGGLATFAENLPGDMLFVMRTMHLVSSLHKALGGSNGARFRTYAACAAEGEWTATEVRQTSATSLFPHAWVMCQRLACCSFLVQLWLSEQLLRIARRRISSSSPAQQFSFASTIADAMNDGA